MSSHVHVTKFDESGQVYNQTTCAGGPMTADWEWKTRGSTREFGRYRSPGPGCCSLSDMAIRSVLQNSYTLTAESLQNLPWALGNTLWKNIVTAQLDSTRTWKAFAAAYRDCPSRILPHQLKIISTPNLPLASYISLINSTSFHWLTFLTLERMTCPRSSLLQISHLTNLAVLTIGMGVSAPDIGIDDSMVRAWGRAAVLDSSAFQVLRVLKLAWQLHITSRVFEYLGGFPELGFVTFDGCGLGPEAVDVASSRGWEYRTGNDRTEHLLENAPTDAGWDSYPHALFSAAGSLGAAKSHHEGVRAVDDLPRLHLALGSRSPKGVPSPSAGHFWECFYRSPYTRKREVVYNLKEDEKSPITELVPKMGNTGPTKRRRVRMSKQQDMVDALIDFT